MSLPEEHELVQCPHCTSFVRRDRLGRHISNVHNSTRRPKPPSLSKNPKGPIPAIPAEQAAKFAAEAARYKASPNPLKAIPEWDLD